MNTDPASPRRRTHRPGRLSALLACLLIVTLLLPAGAGWSAQAAPPAQEPPPSRLALDGPFDLPRLDAGAAPEPEAGPRLVEPEYVTWSKLVFQSARNQRDWDVYIAQGNGSNQANISNHWDMDIHPRLNRGATRVAFASNRQGNFDIFTMAAGGAGQTRLTDHASDDVAPAWSPDGSRIAFQAYRNGQAEIYVMNANGSGQTRLTSHSDYDGEPAWSPDGSQIAFVRRSGGQYRIWAMNADGSNQRQLSNQAYSEKPAWSPDGSQIAYDADGNGDSWQEIWLMNADGSNQREVYDPSEYQTDAWVGGWSPDGRYVAFTRINFVLYQGQWYWDRAYLDAWDSTTPWNTIRLSGSGADWNPDWQSLDLQAPSSSVQQLPPESPATFTVYWTGSDAGPAGIASFDVQMKDGVTGAWTDWQMGTAAQLASYRGIGGHTYFFRARARDNAGNLEAWPATPDASTTVESQPPVTAALPLPDFTRGQQVIVRWDGTDPGGSGIEHYDVQVQDVANGVWNTWLTAVTYTEYAFNGTPGHTYRFRVRGKDRAQNLEAWPPDPGDAQTTLFRWAISGTVRDGSGTPIHGASISTSPAAISPVTSDATGNYLAHVGAEATAYTANATKTGYGSLPATAFPSAQDAQLDLVLPPADNIVRNSNFENSTLQPDWQTGGAIPASVTTALFHTGAQAAWLGRSNLDFTTPANLTNSAADDTNLHMMLDGTGGVHLFWQEQNPGLWPATRYAWRSHDGTWIEPPSIVPAAANSGWGWFAVGPDNAAHVIGWQFDGTRSDLIHATRPPGGNWSVPVILTAAMPYHRLEGDPKIAVGADNTVHVVWSEGEIHRIYWTMRDASGIWRSEPRDISGPTLQGTARPPVLAVDRARQVHVAWGDGRLTRYACRPATGGWMPAKGIRDDEYASSDPPLLAVEANGTAHVAWIDGFYAWGSCQGAWSTPEAVGSGATHQLAVDQYGTVHMLLFSMPKVKYVRRATGGAWSTLQTLAGAPCYMEPGLAVDDSGTAHVLWSGGLTSWQPGTIQLFYTRRTAEPAWSAPVNVSGSAQWLGRDNDRHVLAVDGDGRVHAGWLDGSDGILDVYYATSVPIETAGNSSLSQTLTVPSAMTNPGLSFLYRFGGAAGANDNGFDVKLSSAGATTTLLSTTADTAGWTHQWLNLQPWAGQNVTVHFDLHQAPGDSPAWAAVDEATIGSTYPDIWISSEGTSALPTEPVAYTITYGNRGVVAATGVTISDSLPTGLVFASANPPPSGTGAQLTWNVGSLASNSGPFTITVTARADPPVGLGMVTNTASIASQSAELETHNNNSQVTTFVGHLRYLPVIFRR